MERRTMRRAFVSAFKAHGLVYDKGGWQVSHPEVTWSISLVVDGTGSDAPYRLVLGGSVAELGATAPTNAEDCHLVLPLPWSSERHSFELVMPQAAFPDWRGADEARRQAIGGVVTVVVDYAASVNSLERLRRRYSSGDYGAALIALPLRRLLEAA